MRPVVRHRRAGIRHLEPSDPLYADAAEAVEEEYTDEERQICVASVRASDGWGGVFRCTVLQATADDCGHAEGRGEETPAGDGFAVGEDSEYADGDEVHGSGAPDGGERPKAERQGDQPQRDELRQAGGNPHDVHRVWHLGREDVA